MNVRLNSIKLMSTLLFACVFQYLLSSEAICGTIGCNCSSYKARPIPGKIIVSINQNKHQADVFLMSKGKIRTTYNNSVMDNLKYYGIKKAVKAYQRDNNALYELTFERNGKEREIINYLEMLPNIDCAQQDFTIQFFTEPNDFYYQPDSTDLLNHWVPDTLNKALGNSGTGRFCSTDWQACCPESEVTSAELSYWDDLYLSDQWYLQKQQVNKAWDVTRGDPDVIIMVMDTGIDWQHPDLMNKMWHNPFDALGDMNEDGLPGTSGDDDVDGGRNFNDPEIGNSDINRNDILLWGPDNLCDAGPDGDYGFGPNAIDDYPPGPGGGDDDTVLVGYDPWDDNIRGPGSQNPDSSFNDDLEDVQFLKLDDDENGYPDDYFGINVYDPVAEWPEPDGLPGIKESEYSNEDVDLDGDKHFNDEQVSNADFDGDGIFLCGPDGICDAGDDGDYGFGINAVDDDPEGPGGGDDDTVCVGCYDPWDDNLKGPGTPYDFDDDMDDVRILRYDNEEDGNPLTLPVDDSCPKCATRAGSHGTCMAGIIGAETNNDFGMAGYAWNCKLIAAKFAIGYPESAAEEDSIGATVAIVRALDYAVEKVEKGVNIGVINMSFGFGTEGIHQYVHLPIIEDAIDNAYAHGIIMVSSPGNEREMRYHYPASYPEVISVGGADWRDQEAHLTYNELIDVCGSTYDPHNEPRGDDINDEGAKCITTSFETPPRPIFNFKYSSFKPHTFAVTGLYSSGTAAQVSGLAALLVSLYPKSLIKEIYPDKFTSGIDTFYVSFIRNQIKRGCEPIDSEHPDSLGAGRINAYRSMTQWGVVESDTTWTQFAYVSADLKVDEGVTLDIDPGTVIYFASDDNDDFGVDTTRIVFEVNGTLNINGTAGSPVEMKSLDENPQAGDWYGIWYKGANSGGTINHCKISDAKYGIKSKKTITVRNCEVSNCEIAGIYLYESSGTSNSSIIKHCDFINNTADDASGIQIWNCWDTVLVDSCKVNNNYRGIWLSNTVAQIKHSEIKNNQEDGIWSTHYQCIFTPYPKIQYCKIQGSGENGIYFAATEGEVYKTKIWDGDLNGIYCNHINSKPEIKYSKIIDNDNIGVKITGDGTPILGDVSTGKGQNNSIYDNTRYDVHKGGLGSTTVKAENCYWGANFPDPDKIVCAAIGDSCEIDYTPHLTEDPVPYLFPRSRRKPTRLSLVQNYPNPFGGNSTTIGYSIPKRQHVSLILYDVAGRRVRTLVSKVHQPGHYYAYWNGCNNKGNLVSPGIYFYQLTVGGKSMSRKLVFFR